MIETHTPKWAPFVTGTYERKVDDEGKPERIVVDIRCSRCGATHQARCDSGAPIQWILRFALGHTHRDALIDKFPDQEKKR